MSKFSDLLARALAGIVGASAIIFCVVYNHWTLFGLILVILIFSTREYVRLANLPQGMVVSAYLVYSLVFSIVFLTQYELIDQRSYFLVLPVAFCGLVVQMFQSNEHPLRSLSLYFLGIGYLALPLSLLAFLAFHSSRNYEWEMIFSLFILTWCMDSGAYFFGSAFGRNKLFEKVSPKKSIEGAVGGLLLTLVGAFVLSRYFQNYDLMIWLLMGVVVAVTGLFGDLIESYMKRVAERKDSGSGIPGHGGFLDRFDSLFFSIPFYVALIKFLG